MASIVPSLHAFFVLSCFLLLATASPSTSPPLNCADELVLFSQCLPYVASPPNDLDDAASANCCNAFSAAVKSDAAVCFCYLLQEPAILGFPLNSTRLLSLSSDCHLAHRKSSRAPSLSSLCSESPALPPLDNSGTSGLTVPSSTSGSGSGASSPAITPTKGGGRGGSSVKGGGNGWRPERGGSSGVVVGGGPPHSLSEADEICRSTGWLVLLLLTLLM